MDEDKLNAIYTQIESSFQNKEMSKEEIDRFLDLQDLSVAEKKYLLFRIIDLETDKEKVKIQKEHTYAMLIIGALFLMMGCYISFNTNLHRKGTYILTLGLILVVVGIKKTISPINSDEDDSERPPRRIKRRM